MNQTPTYWKLEPDPRYADTSIRVSCPSLPGVKCDACGQTWTLVNRLALEFDENLLSSLGRKRRPVTALEFQRLRDLIAESGHAEACQKGLIRPGVQFGRAKLDPECVEGAVPVWWFAYQFFIPRQSVPSLEQFESCSLLPCHPPFDWIVEVIPESLPGPEIYRELECEVCGRLRRSSLDEAKYRTLLEQMAERFGLIRVPGAILATAKGRRELEQVVRMGVLFEPVDFARLVQLAR